MTDGIRDGAGGKGAAVRRLSFSRMKFQSWRKVIIAHPYVNAWVQGDGALRISVRRQRTPRDTALK